MWQGGKDGRVVRWEGGRFMGGEHSASPRLYLFFIILSKGTKRCSDINQGTKGMG